MTLRRYASESSPSSVAVAIWRLSSVVGCRSTCEDALSCLGEGHPGPIRTVAGAACTSQAPGQTATEAAPFGDSARRCDRPAPPTRRWSGQCCAAQNGVCRRDCMFHIGTCSAASARCFLGRFLPKLGGASQGAAIFFCAVVAACAAPGSWMAGRDGIRSSAVFRRRFSPSAMGRLADNVPNDFQARSYAGRDRRCSGPACWSARAGSCAGSARAVSFRHSFD